MTYPYNPANLLPLNIPGPDCLVPMYMVWNCWKPRTIHIFRFLDFYAFHQKKKQKNTAGNGNEITGLEEEVVRGGDGLRGRGIYTWFTVAADVKVDGVCVSDDALGNFNPDCWTLIWWRGTRGYELCICGFEALRRGIADGDQRKLHVQPRETTT